MHQEPTLKPLASCMFSRMVVSSGCRPSPLTLREQVLYSGFIVERELFYLNPYSNMMRYPLNGCLASSTPVFASY